MTKYSWIAEQRRIYTENAGVIRDFRSQMRTFRPFFGWIAYLGIVFLVTGISYYAISSTSNLQAAQLQDRLGQLFIVLVWLLGILVSMTTPALTISSIIAEFERGSIDLVMSAPVHPKYLLVGKLLSAYRYAWLLLILALPFAATGVVMGGFTYMQVLQIFFCMSLQALIAGAVGLAVSTLTRKTVNALMQTYAILFLGSLVLSAFGLTTILSGAMSGTREAPFFGLLVPGMCLFALDTFTRIGSWEVPNWILATVFTLGVVRLLLLGAASGLQFTLNKEIIGLRIGGLIAAFLVMILLSSGGSAAFAGLGPGMSVVTGQQLAASFVVITGLGLLAIMNYLSCWQFVGDRKYLSNGFFDPRLMLRGTPAGNVPYMLALFMAALGGYVTGGILGRMNLDGSFWLHMTWAPAFWLFFLGLGWWSSVLNKVNAQAARRLQGAFLVIMLAVSSVALSFVQANTMGMEIISVYHPLAGAVTSEANVAIIHTSLYAATGAVLLLTAEMKRREIIRSSYGSPLP
ncbi:MAG: hypothetical protein KF812_00450 [Fimbriimonadaceae bacterium]|nr:hypothetical protein [Fimbriimonadaceae bacterium]